MTWIITYFGGSPNTWLMDNALSAQLEPWAQLAAIAGVFSAVALWELAAPARALRLARPSRWCANLGLALLNAALARVLLPISALATAALAAEEGWGLLHHVALSGWAAVVCAVVLLDLAMYLQHVLFHAVPALWRLHAVHHADPDFDLTTGMRFHPLQILLAAPVKLAVIAALGAPVVAVLIFEVLLGAAAMFTHANVSLPRRLERWVRLLLVTPDMHRIHHSVVVAEQNSNYGFCLSVWDRLLGTYTAEPCGGRSALDIGLSGQRDPTTVTTLRGTLEMPFVRDDKTAMERL